MSIKCFGLPNPASICYFNSLFQVLISSYKFVLVNKEHGKETSILRKICNDLLNDKFDVLDYLHLIKLVKNKTTQSMSNQCSDEYFITMMDNIAQPIKDLFTLQIQIKHSCTKCTYNVNTTETTIILESTYQGPVVNSRQLEYLKRADEKCPQCDGKHIVEYLVTKTSDLLYVLVQEHKKPRTFPETMQLCDSNYELIGIVEHFGGLMGGHYTAIGKRAGQYYLFNDTYYKKLEHLLTTGQQRIILYEKSNIVTHS